MPSSVPPVVLLNNYSIILISSYFLSMKNKGFASGIAYPQPDAKSWLEWLFWLGRSVGEAGLEM
jgi:hypothetical protein